MIQKLLLVVCSCVFSTSVNASTTMTFYSVADATLYEDAFGGQASGSGSGMFVGKTGGGAIRRALVAFDLSFIPAGSQILSVALGLEVTRSISSDSAVTAHRATRGWTEGASDAGNRDGGGVSSQPGDATWLHTSYNTAFWSTPGGDFIAAPSASTLVSGIDDYSWSSAAMTADVQSWVDSPVDNFGWLLRGNESENASAKRFSTSEGPAPPSLTITYQAVPEPSRLILAAIGAMALMMRRRRNACLTLLEKAHHTVCVAVARECEVHGA